MDVLNEHALTRYIIRIAQLFSSILVFIWVLENIIFEAEIDFTQFLAQVIYVILIITWVIGEPWLYRLLMEIGDCFPDKKYRELYEDYVSPTPNNPNKCNVTRMNLDIAYFIIWVFIICFTGISLVDIVSSWTLTFLIFYACLSIISTYRAIFFLKFLYHISRSDVVSCLEHNRYFPASTYGFCKLNDIAKTLARTFLTIMFLFTIAYVLSVTQGLINSEASTHKIIQLFFGVILCGWLVQFAVIFAPKQYFRRILLSWTYAAIKDKQAEIYTIGLDSITRNRLSEEILKIHSALKPNIPIFEIIMAILTLVINISGMLFSISI